MKIQNKFLVIMIVFTLLAITVQNKILKRKITIHPSEVFQHEIYGDIDSGGNSQAELISTDPTFRWTCSIANRTANHPYCTLGLFIGKSDEIGLNLTHFHSIKLWLEYQGNTDSIRVYLRNFDPNYSDKLDYTSTKYNQVEISKQYLKKGTEIELRNFNVPTWWQLDRKLSPQHMTPDFSNVINLDFQTGTNALDGVHEFNLTKVEFHGQWMKTETWYLSIILIWMSALAVRMIHNQVSLIKKIEVGSQREQALKEQNKILDKQGRKFKTKAETDNLTGALNRTGAELKLNKALQEKQKNGDTFSIILIDIDHFKHINDTLGHDSGDEVLKQFSKLIQNNIRATDYFARWGGEEFMVICRQTTLLTAVDIAEQLRSVISSSIVIGDIIVTASLGVAEVDGDDQASINDAFKRADQALYVAKRHGRNRVEVASLKNTEDTPFPNL